MSVSMIIDIYVCVVQHLDPRRVQVLRALPARQALTRLPPPHSLHLLLMRWSGLNPPRAPALLALALAGRAARAPALLACALDGPAHSLKRAPAPLPSAADALASSAPPLHSLCSRPRSGRYRFVPGLGPPKVATGSKKHRVRWENGSLRPRKRHKFSLRQPYCELDPKWNT